MMLLDTHSLKIPSPVDKEISRHTLISSSQFGVPFRLVALLAPSGYGKTTLLAQYARLHAPFASWLSLSEDCQDFDFFVSSLRSSLEQVFPLSFPLSFPAFSALLRSKTHTPRSLAHALSTDLSQLSSPLKICIDQIQHLGPLAFAFLNALLEYLPTEHQVLCSGYVGGSLKVATLLSKHQALVLGPEQLKFSPQEVDLYVQERGYMGLDLSVLDGWPAGLCMQARPSRSLYLDPQTLVQESLSELLDVYPSLPELSVLPVWSESLASDFGIALPQGWLTDLFGRGLLLLPLERFTYRPHRLLRTALEDMLKKDPGCYIDLNCRVAHVLENQGRPLEALKHYKKAGFMEGIFRILRSVTFEFLTKIEDPQLFNLFEGLNPYDLPLDLFDTFVCTQACSNTLSHEHKIEWLELAYTRGCRSGLLFKTLGDLEYDRCRFAAAAHWLDLGLGEPHLKDNLALLRTKIMHAYRSPDTPERQALIEHTFNVGCRQENPNQRAVTLVICGEAYLHVGEFERSLAYALEASKIFLEVENIRYHIMAEKVILGSWMGMGDWEQAFSVAEKVQEVLKPLILEREIFVDLSFIEDFFLSQNRVQEALWLCQASMENPYRQVFLFLKMSQAKAMEIHAGRGDRAEALQLYATLRAIDRYGLDRYWGSFDVHMGIGAYLLGEEVEARKWLGQALPHLVQPIERIRALVYLSELDFRAKGHSGYAEELLSLRGMCTFPRFTEFDAQHTPLTQAYLGVATPEKAEDRTRIHIHTFGRFHISVGQENRYISSRRAQEVLVFLAIHGPATRDQIIDAVWGEALNVHHIDHFKVSVHRLRRFLVDAFGLEVNPIGYEGGEYRLVETLDWSIDLSVLQNDVRNVADFKPKLELYLGSWMRESQSEWFDQTRVQVGRLRYQALLIWGKMWMDRDIVWALACFEQAVQLEPLEEDGYSHLIACFSRMSRHREARGVYKRMTDLWIREFGLSPRLSFAQIVGDPSSR